MPSRMAGRPSTRNNHCHPARPPNPARWVMIQPDTGPATRPEIGTPVAKMLMARPPISAREPIGHVKHDTGKEPRLCRADQKAQGIERVGGLREGEEHGEDAPRHHDPQQRDLYPVAVEHQIARNLEENVADVQNASGRAEDRLAEMQAFHELQLREADVEAIDHRDEIAEQQKGKQPEPDAAIERRTGCGGSFDRNAGSVSTHRQQFSKGPCTIAMQKRSAYLPPRQTITCTWRSCPGKTQRTRRHLKDNEPADRSTAVIVPSRKSLPARRPLQLIRLTWAATMRQPIGKRTHVCIVRVIRPALVGRDKVATVP